MPRNIFKIFDGRNYFWQWDTNQKLIVLDDTVDEVHFSNRDMTHAISKDVFTDKDGKRVCYIPDTLLTLPRNLIAAAIVTDDNANKTLKQVKFAVQKRAIPSDYVVSDDVQSEDLTDRLNIVEEIVEDMRLNLPNTYDAKGSAEQALFDAKSHMRENYDPIGSAESVMNNLTEEIARAKNEEAAITRALHQMNDRVAGVEESIDTKVGAHNTSPDSHADIRELISELYGQNVTDVTKYGATGDGQTDDTEAIATAMAAVPVGGTLYFPVGTYMVDNVFAKSDMTIRGAGWGSVIKLLPSITDYDGRNSCINIENAERVIVRDIKLDGNRETQRTNGEAQDQRLNGIFIMDSTDILIDNVWMYNNGYHGCIMVRAGGVAISRCKSSDNGYRPIHGHTEIYNCRVSRCLCENNGLGLRDSDNTDPGPGFDGLFFFGVQALTISDNIIRSNRMCSICVGADNETVATGTVIESRNISITGNVCECYENLAPDYANGKQPSRGIAIYGGEGALRNVVIAGNTIRNAHEALYIYASDNIVTDLNVAVTGNTITDCSVGAQIVEVADVNISGNQFRNMQKQWLYMQSVEHCMIGGNNVYAPGASEYRLVLMYNCKDIAFSGNHVIGRTAVAVYSPQGNVNVVVKDNIISGFGNADPVTNPDGITQGNVIVGAEQEMEKVYAGLYSNYGFVRNTMVNPYTGSDSYMTYTTPIPITDTDVGYELNTYISIPSDTDPDDYTSQAGTQPAIVFLAGDALADAVGIVPLYTVGNGTRTYNRENYIPGDTNTFYGVTLSISAEKVRELYPTATYVLFQIEKDKDPAAQNSTAIIQLGDGKSYVYRTV